MNLLLGRPYFFEVTDPKDGMKKVAPFIHVIMDIGNQGTKLVLNKMLNIVYENEPGEKRFTCNENELIAHMEKFLNFMENAFELHSIPEGLSQDYFKYHLRTIQRGGGKVDEFKVYDTSSYVYYLTGIGMKNIQTFERYTMSGYPLVLVNEDKGRKPVKMLTTEDFEKQVARIRKGSIQAFSFEFANQKILMNPHFIVFDGYFRKKLVEEYYIIDANPVEQNQKKKSYFAAPRAFIQSAITVNSPERAYPFRNEDDAVSWAMNNLNDFPSGGFEIVRIPGKRYVYENSSNNPA